jgi:hypothetical protein
MHGAFYTFASGLKVNDSIVEQASVLSGLVKTHEKNNMEFSTVIMLANLTGETNTNFLLYQRYKTRDAKLLSTTSSTNLKMSCRETLEVAYIF